MDIPASLERRFYDPSSLRQDCDSGDSELARGIWGACPSSCVPLEIPLAQTYRIALFLVLPLLAKSDARKTAECAFHRYIHGSGVLDRSAGRRASATRPQAVPRTDAGHLPAKSLSAWPRCRDHCSVLNPTCSEPFSSRSSSLPTPSWKVFARSSAWKYCCS